MTRTQAPLPPHMVLSARASGKTGAGARLAWAAQAALQALRAEPEPEADDSCQACGRLGTEQCPVMITQREDGERANGKVTRYCRHCGAVSYAFAGETTGADPEDQSRGSAGNTVKFQGGGVAAFANRLRHANAMLKSPVPPAALERAIALREAAGEEGEAIEHVEPFLRKAAAEAGEKYDPLALEQLYTRHVAYSGMAGLTPRKGAARRQASRHERYGNAPEEIPGLAAECLEGAARALERTCQLAAAAIRLDLASERRLPQFAAEYVAAAAVLGLGCRHELRSRVAPAVAVALAALGCPERAIVIALRGRACFPRLRREMLAAGPRLAPVFERAGLAAPQPPLDAAGRLIARLLREFA